MSVRTMNDVMTEIEEMRNRAENHVDAATKRIWELEARIAELEAASQWRRIAEAPKVDRKPLLLRVSQYRMFRTLIQPEQFDRGWWSSEHQDWVDAYGIRLVPTHYMPAPPAPEPKEAL